MKRSTLILRGGPFNGYRTDRVRRLKAQWRREALRDERLCINGRTHGAATHGVRCERCAVVHRSSATKSTAA